MAFPLGSPSPSYLEGIFRGVRRGRLALGQGLHAGEQRRESASHVGHRDVPVG